VNLPKAYKMSPPRYQAITSGQIPAVNLAEAGYARIIAGELDGVRGPAKTFTPLNVFDVRLNAGREAVLRLPQGHNTALVALKGQVGLGVREFGDSPRTPSLPRLRPGSCQTRAVRGLSPIS
jgi:hypothetical protein